MMMMMMMMMPFHFPQRPCHTSSGNEGVLGNPKTNPLFKGGNQVKITYSKITRNMGKNGVSSLQYGLNKKNIPLICKGSPKRKRHDHQVFLNFLPFKSASTWKFCFFPYSKPDDLFYEPTRWTSESFTNWRCSFMRHLIRKTKSEKSTKRNSPPKLESWNLTKTNHFDASPYQPIPCLFLPIFCAGCSVSAFWMGETMMLCRDRSWGHKACHGAMCWYRWFFWRSILSKFPRPKCWFKYYIKLFNT